jgi:hypothetical protein
MALEAPKMTQTQATNHALLYLYEISKIKRETWDGIPIPGIDNDFYERLGVQLQAPESTLRTRVYSIKEMTKGILPGLRIIVNTFDGTASGPSREEIEAKL